MYTDLKVSSILVIGGSGGIPSFTSCHEGLLTKDLPTTSDYFDVADTVIMMQSYVPQ